MVFDNHRCAAEASTHQDDTLTSTHITRLRCEDYWFLRDGHPVGSSLMLCFGF